ncbi:putative sporulation protein YtxC [Clostridium niameyense]|uniref:putative sporulation protein YtxC n=1 Tax=Clostridium niameyense TaxID=1622073 RepID=UPI00067E67C5|nr:putative sporulation protein YtxC [Clostridium niameyense]
MLIFTLVYNKDRENIIEDTRKLVEDFRKKGVIIGISESIENKTHFVKVYSEKTLNDRVLKDFNIHMSNILYNIVVDEFINSNMYDFIRDTYFFLKNEDIVKIKKRILQVLKTDKFDLEDSIYCLNKKNAIINKISKIINENNELNIDGFITFRIKSLSEDLQGIVEKIVEKYMVDKEYSEFIKLLKYFVEIEESKIDEINIIIEKGGKYTLKDSEGKDLTEEVYIDVDDIKFIENINLEDMIISWLITNVPNKIKIYGLNNCKNKEFINTIKNVFENRVSCYNNTIELLNKIKF